MALESLASIRSQILGNLMSQYTDMNSGTPKWMTQASSWNTGSGKGLVTLGGGGQPKPAQSHHHSVGGFFDNALNGLEQTVTGIPRGLTALVEHPIGTAKAVAHSYAVRYSPLLHGHFGAFAEQVYHDPTSYALDAVSVAATIGSLGMLAPEAAAIDGGAAAAAATRGVAEAGQVGEGVDAANAAAEAAARGNTLNRFGHEVQFAGTRNPVKYIGQRTIGKSALVHRMSGLDEFGQPVERTLTTDSGKVIGRNRTYSQNHYIRARQKMLDSLGTKVPNTGPLRYMSEGARASRFQARMAERGVQGLKGMTGRLANLSKKLSPAEFQALHVRATGLTADRIIAHMEKVRDQGVVQAEGNGYHVLKATDVRHLVHNPSEAMKAYETEARHFGQDMAQLKVEMGILHPKTAENSMYRMIQHVRGATFHTPAQSAKLADEMAQHSLKAQKQLDDHIAQTEHEIARKQALLEHFDRRNNPVHGEQLKALEAQKADLRMGLESLDHRVVKLQQMKHDAEDLMHEHLKNLHGGYVGSAANRSRIEDIQADIAAGHSDFIGKGHEPFYMPQSPVEEASNHATTIGGRGGGSGPQNMAERANLHNLLDTNRLIWDSDTYGGAHARFVKQVLYSKLHGVIMSEAHEVVAGDRLRSGEQYVRRNVREKISPIVRRASRKGARSYYDSHAGLSEEQAMLDANRGSDLHDLPGEIKVGDKRLHFGSNSDIQRIAKDYTDERGLEHNPPRQYAQIDEARAAKIAREYDKLEHNPNDPAVKASYEAFIRETKLQYDHLVREGYTFDFHPNGDYANAREGQLDLHANKHLSIRPSTGEVDHTNLLSRDSGVRWHGQPVSANDLFRAVHDVFGHGKEGVGFRGPGEENAWRQHAAMYSHDARGAMTSETRGQNSWVNSGPHGEFNRTASADETIFAPQKNGIMSPSALYAGAHDVLPSEADTHAMDVADASGMFTTDPELAQPGEHPGTLMAVRSDTVKAITGEYAAGGQFLQWMAKGPVKVWKSLLLGYRPAFMVNNVVGNAFLMAARNDPIAVAEAMFRTLRAEHGDAHAISILGRHDLTPREIHDYFMQKYFPGISGGGHGGGMVDMMTNDLKGKASRGLFIAPTMRVEQLYRLAATRAILQKLPQYAHFERMLFGGTRPLSFEEWAKSMNFHYHGTSEEAGRSIAADGELRPTPLGVHTSSDLQGVAHQYAGRDEAGTGAVAIVHPDDITAAGGHINGPLGHSHAPIRVRGVVQPGGEQAWMREAYSGYVKGFPAASAIPKQFQWMHVSEAMLKADPRIADRVGQEVLDSLGNYNELSAVERNVVKSLFPFYAWYKHILRSTFALPEHNPLRAEILANLGRVGTDIQAHQDGKNMPTWMRGAIPIGFNLPGFTADDQHRHNLLMTSSLNPFATIAEEAAVAKGLTGRRQASPELMGTINPLISTGYEALSGKSNLTGQPITDPGLQHMTSMFTNLPQVSAFESIGKHNKPSQVYAGNFPQYAWALAGAPVKQVNLKAANRLGKSIAKSEEPAKPYHRKGRHHAQPAGLPVL